MYIFPAQVLESTVSAESPASFHWLRVFTMKVCQIHSLHLLR